MTIIRHPFLLRKHLEMQSFSEALCKIVFIHSTNIYPAGNMLIRDGEQYEDIVLHLEDVP